MWIKGQRKEEGEKGEGIGGAYITYFVGCDCALASFVRRYALVHSVAVAVRMGRLLPGLEQGSVTSLYSSC
jgi:hypothetical protein